MDLAEAVQTFVQKYAVFSGRAPRSEYWWFHLSLGLVYGFFVTLAMALRSELLLGLAVLVVVVALLPSYAVTVRRLHDTGRSAWHLLWSFVPLGWLVLLYFMVQRSEEGENRYGRELGTLPSVPLRVA